MSDFDPSDDVFDDNTFNATFTSFDTRLLEKLGIDDKTIKNLTTSEFLREAFIAAGTIANVAGDGDGFIGETANTIRQNLLIALTQIQRAPEEFVIAALATEQNPKDRINRLAATIEALDTHLDALIDADKKEAL